MSNPLFVRKMANRDYINISETQELPYFFRENVLGNSEKILLVSGVNSSPGALARLAEESRNSGSKYSKIYVLGNLFSPRGGLKPSGSNVSRDELVLMTLAMADAIIIPGSNDLAWTSNFSKEGISLLKSFSGNYSASPTKETRCYFASPGDGPDSRNVPTVPLDCIGNRLCDIERLSEGVEYRYVTVEDALENARKEGISAVFTGASIYSPEFRYSGTPGKGSREVNGPLSEKKPLKLPLNPETPLLAEIPKLATAKYNGLGSYGVLVAPGGMAKMLEIVSFKPVFVSERSFG